MRQLQSRLSHWHAVGQTPQLWPSSRRLLSKARPVSYYGLYGLGPTYFFPSLAANGKHVRSRDCVGCSGAWRVRRGWQHAWCSTQVGCRASPVGGGGGGGVTKRENTERGGAATGGVCVGGGGWGGGGA